MNIQTRKLILIALAFVAIPVLYTFEISHLNQTLHAGQMMMIALVIGLVIGIVLGYRLQKNSTDTVERMRTYAACIILSALTLPLLVSLSNRLLSFRPTQRVQVEFVEESPRFSNRFGAFENAIQPTSYFTFFYKNSELLKIQTSESLFPDAKRGDLVTLPLKRGLWGFEFVAKNE